jgi:hypothetical protein
MNYMPNDFKKQAYFEGSMIKTPDFCFTSVHNFALNNPEGHQQYDLGLGFKSR